MYEISSEHEPTIQQELELNCTIHVARQTRCGTLLAKRK